MSPSPCPRPDSPTDFPGSFDPNDIIGPAGYGPEGFIAADMVLPYTIRFENQATASAAAQIVTVTQQLDDDLDITTVELGDLGWGDTVVEVPAGLNAYATRIDMRATHGVDVDVQATVNLPERTITWNLTALDPATGVLTADPYAGFLPPNRTAPEGEGFVSYRVRHVADKGTGTRINAAARIFFDVNAPIDTPLITNTLDLGAPTSSVHTLPATSNRNFSVSWSGADDTGGAGVGTYDVYVSDNGGPWTLWLFGTSATSAVYPGVPNHRYGFFSVATDHVGHRQPTPTKAQATTLATKASAVYLPLVVR